MHIIRSVLSVCLLAFLLLALPVTAGECPDGMILYRQAFNELSKPENGGICKGIDGAEGFSLTIEDEALTIDNHSDRKSYTIFPASLPQADHTVEFSFSFDRIDASNAYASFMLTSRGAEPDNITGVTFRVNGECEGFGKLSDELTEKITSGEIVSVKIPVKNGDHYEMTVTSDGISETLTRKTVGGIPKGNIGFMVRNASVKVYDVAVVNGIGYNNVTGVLKDSSTWNDDNPYSSGEGVFVKCGDEDVFLKAPQTGDEALVAMATLLVSAISAWFLRRRVSLR